MDRLGYGRYVAQGGDLGSAVTTAIGAQDAEHCAGIHVTLAMSARPNVEGKQRPGGTGAGRELNITPNGIPDIQAAIDPATNPGYGLTDSPSGQAA